MRRLLGVRCGLRSLRGKSCFAENVLGRRGAIKVLPTVATVKVATGPTPAANQRLIPLMDITDPKMPTVVVFQEVKNQGWTPVKHAVQHNCLFEPEKAMEFDSRLALRQKWYFQALATLPKTLPLIGDNPLPSFHPVLFYRLLLRGEKCLPNQSAKDYARQWNRSTKTAKADLAPIEDEPAPRPIDTGEEFFEPDVGGPRPKPRARPAALHGPQRGRGQGRGRGARGAPPPVPLPPAPLPPAPLPPPGGVPPEPPGGGVVAPAPPGGLEGVGNAEEFFAPDEEPRRPAGRRRAENEDLPVISFNGCRVWFHGSYVTPQGVHQPNWVMECRNPEHGHCQKRRGATVEFERHHGAIEPLAFLHAWVPLHWPTKPGVPSHARENPSQAQTDAVVAEFRSQLEEVCRQVGR